jgi:lactoylglutathione lyase
MGMKLVRTLEMKAASFNLYFLGYETPGDKDHAEGLLELTWNYGTEKDPGFKYHNGNAEPQGFGHICVSVDDLQAACDRFEAKGVSLLDCKMLILTCAGKLEEAIGGRPHEDDW